MPELPEVETIRRGLISKVLNKQIKAIKIAKPHLVRNKASYFNKTLLTSHFSDIDRIGKLLIFQLANKKTFLLIHLKMTGQLIYKDKHNLIAGGHKLPKVEDLPNKYSHIIFDFSDRSNLFFNDMRQFGYLQLVDKETKDKIVAKYGPEPGRPDFNLANFKKILAKRRTLLKALLLNQNIIAGIGNIYADEICYRAKVLPTRRVSSLSDKEIDSLFRACQYIIAKAIVKGGTTFSDYRTAEGKKGSFRNSLKVYGRQDKRCLRCGHIIAKMNLVGRGTHYCANCQN